MMVRKCWFLLLALLAAACSAKTIAPTPTPTLPQQTATPTAAPPTATPTPAFYVIQPGDTLSLIAEQFGVPLEELQKANDIDDPNLIRVNQKLIIPGPTPVVTATLPPTLTPTPDVPPQLEIVDVIGRGAPGTETVIIVNRGRTVLLKQWTLRDAQSNAFVFPNIYLGEGAELRIHTGSGENTPQNLFWNRDTAVWEEAGDTVILADERGVVYASKPLE